MTIRQRTTLLLAPFSGAVRQHCAAASVDYFFTAAHSQGCLYYDVIPNMPETTLLALMDRFQNFIAENKVTDAIFRVL
jgi:hypothetical protein